MAFVTFLMRFGTSNRPKRKSTKRKFWTMSSSDKSVHTRWGSGTDNLKLKNSYNLFLLVILSKKVLNYPSVNNFITNYKFLSITSHREPKAIEEAILKIALTLYWQTLLAYMEHIFDHSRESWSGTSVELDIISC